MLYNLKILIQEKNDLLAHYGAQNVGKRERCKHEKIKKIFLSYTASQKKLTKKSRLSKKMQMLKKVKQTIIKKVSVPRK